MKAVATAGPDRREGRERSVGPMRKGKGLERQGRWVAIYWPNIILKLRDSVRYDH